MSKGLTYNRVVLLYGGERVIYKGYTDDGQMMIVRYFGDHRYTAIPLSWVHLILDEIAVDEMEAK